MSSAFRSWIRELPETRIVHLFATHEHVIVHHRVNRNGRELILRSQEMENAVIDVVEKGLRDDDWLGMLYVMGWGDLGSFRPLYIGKAGKCGRKNPISANLEGISTKRDKFARWGDGRAYHVGALSQVLFGWDAYIGPDDKYTTWCDMLFRDRNPPTLREPVKLLVIPWWKDSIGPSGDTMSLEDAEEEAIETASLEFENLVLNAPGDVWWAPRATSHARPPDAEQPRLPVRLVEREDAMGPIVEELMGEPIVGLDVETTLFGHELRIVQIAGREFTAVIDVLRLAGIDSLSGLLGTRGPTKVIHNAPFERRVLGEQGIDVAPVFDTLKSSRAVRGRRKKHDLGSVCERELGRKLNKTMQTSDWSRRPLSKQQITYAALDAEVLLDLYDVFTKDQLRLEF